MSNENTAPFGVLLVNLGTPDKADAPSVRRYLREFLSDPRVIHAPRLIWWCALNLVILLIRPPKVAKLYQTVWTNRGSPLLAISQQQQQDLQSSLQQLTGQNIPVELAMTYGNPGIDKGIANLMKSGIQRLIVLPMYPQYSGTTTAAVFDAIARNFRAYPNLPEMIFIRAYWQHPDYQQCLANSIDEYWQSHGKPDRLLLSFHGIPQSYEDQGDPYPQYSRDTARGVAERLGLLKDQWTESFQSRFGREEWVKPYTDVILQEWGEQDDIKRVDVVCPAFSADCLETLEEIAEQNKEIFLHAGGKEYHYIPCLNNRPDHIAFLSQLVLQRAQAWKS